MGTVLFLFMSYSSDPGKKEDRPHLVRLVQGKKEDRPHFVPIFAV
jgi:hypothetical protein